LNTDPLNITVKSSNGKRRIIFILWLFKFTGILTTVQYTPMK